MMHFRLKDPIKRESEPGLHPYVNERSPRNTRMGALPKFLFVVVLIGIFIVFDVVEKIVGKMDGLERSLLCTSGALESSLHISRILCEVDTKLDTLSFRDAFESSGTNNTADYEVDRPGGSDNVAFVVTIPSCPDDLTHPTADDDPGAAFYDAAAVLRDSICNCTAPESADSNYTNTMYAIIHPDATICAGPSSNARRLSSNSRSLSEYTYDRVAILEELGYWVIIWREPVSFYYQNI